MAFFSNNTLSFQNNFFPRRGCCGSNLIPSLGNQTFPIQNFPFPSQLGSGTASLQVQGPLTSSSTTTLSALPQNVTTSGVISTFSNALGVVSGFTVNANTVVTLIGSVNVTSVPTGATVLLQIVNNSGTVLASTPVTAGTNTVSVLARAFAVLGTNYSLQLVIQNADGSTSVTVNSGTFSIAVGNRFPDFCERVIVCGKKHRKHKRKCCKH